MSVKQKIIMAYNDYAKKWSKRISQGTNLVQKYIEKPAIYDKLPNLKGKTVLCVGCGTGEECDYIKSVGAKKVIGIDIAKQAIKYAETKYPNIEFYQADIEKINFPASTFDLVYSSLTFHHLKNWAKALKQIHNVLKNDGTFLFSFLHPLRTAMQITRRNQTSYSFSLGYSRDSKNDYQIHGDYLNNGQIDDIWFNEFKIIYYHRSLSYAIKEIIDSGFKIADFTEPRPTTDLKKIYEHYWRVRSKIPLIAVFELKKN